MTTTTTRAPGATIPRTARGPLVRLVPVDLDDTAHAVRSAVLRVVTARRSDTQETRKIAYLAAALILQYSTAVAEGAQ